MNKKRNNILTIILVMAIVIAIFYTLKVVFTNKEIEEEEVNLAKSVEVIDASLNKDSAPIVLIDKINKNIKNGMEYQEAIVDGGVSRMQPIFLTSLTTVAGIFPLIWASEMWRGFSITVISGLIFSTMLTLVIMPVLYYGMCRPRKMND